jgi:transposase
MAMLAEQVDGVIGVDTHRDTLTAAAVTRLGGVLAQITISTDAAGYQQLLDFACVQVPGRRLWAVEGAGSYGAGLAAFLQQHGEQAVEIGRPKRPASRSGANSDALDAVRAAREALGRDHLAIPRRRGEREALRVLLTTRRSATTARVAAISQLKALIVGAPEELRAELRGRSTAKQIQHCAALRQRPARSLEHQATVRALRATAQRIQALQTEADQLQAELTVLVTAVAPWLLEVPGVGPISAAQVLVSWSHAGRFRSEAAFAPWPAPTRSPPPPGRWSATASTAAGTASSTAPCTPSCWCACAPIPTPAPTWRVAPPRARAAATPSGACDASSPASCTGCWSATTNPASRSSARLDRT